MKTFTMSQTYFCSFTATGSKLILFSANLNICNLAVKTTRKK